MTQLGGQHVDPFVVADPSELSDWRLPLSFMKPRHGTEANEGEQNQESWRMKDRVSLFETMKRIAFQTNIIQMKTWSVALVLCLNIGVDPPDVVKTNPCARKECWIGEQYIGY